MKLISLLFCIFSLNSLAQACPDISGQFQGRCTETFYTHPEANKNPELRFEIQQTQCNEVTVSMTAVTSGAKTTDTFDLSVEKMEMLDTGSHIIYSSGMFTSDKFIGVTEYISKKTGIFVMYFNTKYSKADKGGTPHLTVDQGSTNYRLECEIPAVN